MRRSIKIIGGVVLVLLLWLGTAEAAYQYGQVLKGQGRSNDSVRWNRIATKIDPLHIRAQLNRAEFLSSRRRYSEAVENWRWVVLFKPRDARSRTEYGWSLYSMGKTDDGYRELVRAIELDPNDARAQWYLGNYYMEKGDAKTARQYYDKAVRLEAGNPYYTLGQASAYFALEEFDIAEERYRRVIQLNPDLPTPYARLASIRLRQKRFEEALAFVEQALSRDYNEGAGQSVLVQYVAGRVFEESGRVKEAITAYQNVVSYAGRVQDNISLQRIQLARERLTKLEG